MTGRVMDRDLGLRKIVNTMSQFDGRELRVGIQGPEAGAIEHDGSALSNVELGAIHEFGAPSVGIPERSFIRATWNANIERWTSSTLPAIAAKVYSSSPDAPQRALGVLGEVIVGEIRKTMARGIPPPLTASGYASRLRRRQGGRAQLARAQRSRGLAALGAGIELEAGRMQAKPLIDTGQLRNSITWRVK